MPFPIRFAVVSLPATKHVERFLRGHPLAAVVASRQDTDDVVVPRDPPAHRATRGRPEPLGLSDVPRIAAGAGRGASRGGEISPGTASLDCT